MIYIIVWISVCAADIIGYGFWYSAITKKSSGVAYLQSQIDVKTKTLERVALARTTLAEISGNESAVQSYFIHETGVVSFIDDLESRARKQSANMKVLSVSVGDSVKRPTMILTTTISGTFESVMRTIGAVEYAPYSVSISRLSIVNEEKNKWTANLEIVVGSVKNL